jgi:hypothetical protein
VAKAMVGEFAQYVVTTVPQPGGGA